MTRKTSSLSMTCEGGSRMLNCAGGWRPKCRSLRYALPTPASKLAGDPVRAPVEMTEPNVACKVAPGVGR